MTLKMEVVFFQYAQVELNLNFEDALDPYKMILVTSH